MLAYEVMPTMTVTELRPLDYADFTKLRSRIEAQGGRSLGQAHRATPIEYEGGEKAETCGCGQRKQLILKYNDYRDEHEERVLVCADCDAVARYPRFHVPE